MNGRAIQMGDGTDFRWLRSLLVLFLLAFFCPSVLAENLVCGSGQIKVYLWGGVEWEAASPGCGGDLSHPFMSEESWSSIVRATCKASSGAANLKWGPIRDCVVNGQQQVSCGTGIYGRAMQLDFDHPQGYRASSPGAAETQPYCVAGYYLFVPQASTPPSGNNCQCSRDGEASLRPGSVTVGDPIDPSSGSEHQQETDYVTGDSRFEISRAYNSAANHKSGIGYNWQFNFMARIEPLWNGASRYASVSGVYSSASQACVQGWPQIAAAASREWPDTVGATASYDTSNGISSCKLSTGRVISVSLSANDAASVLMASSAPSNGQANVAALLLRRQNGGTFYFICHDGQCAANSNVRLKLSVSSAGFQVVDDQGRTEQYDTQGRLISILNRDGYRRDLQYTGDNLTQVSDTAGRSVTFSYSGNLISQVGLPDGQSIQYFYTDRGELSQVLYPDGHSIRYQYKDDPLYGLLTGVADDDAAPRISITYDAQGRATGDSQAGGTNATSLSYLDSASTSVTDRYGVARTYRFTMLNGMSLLSNIEGAPCQECAGAQVQYDAQGYPSAVTDFKGQLTQFVYDPTGLLQSRVEVPNDLVQRTVAFTWDTGLRLPLTRKLADSVGKTASLESWVYNSRGQVAASCVVDAVTAPSYACAVSGAVPVGVQRNVYTYCDAVDASQCPRVGLLLSVTGPRTDVTSTAHYSYYLSTDESGCGTAGGACHRAGDLYQVTDAVGHVRTAVAYDKNGRVVRERDANGVVTDSTYHARGWLLIRAVRANADGTPSSNDAITQIGYTPYGAVASVKDPDGVQVTYTYDAAHRLTDITDALGNRIHYTLDAAGNKTKEETFDAGNTLRRSLARSYNTLGQLTTIKDGLSRTVFDASFTDSYDGNGNLVRSADALGIQRKQGYDALNRLVSTIDNYNGTDTATQNTQSVFAYDAKDQLQGVSDPDGLNTTYDYDGLGNAKAVHSPDTGTSSFVYDAAGNRIQATDARGVVSHSTFDALNRITATTYPTSDANVSYRYDEANSVTGCSGSYPVGRLTSVVETAVTTVYCYDAHGNVVQKRQTQGTAVDTVSYTYTLADRLASTRTPDGTAIQYSRDSAGRINGVTAQTPGSSNAGNVVTNVSYLPFGPIASYTLGNGQTLTRTYDANYAVTDVVSPALNLHFARDAMGNITALGNAAGANPAIETYSYDPLYRLTGLKDAQGQAIEAYTYNKTGDRLSKTSNGLATGTYGYQAGTHWLTSIGSSARTYDANGNTTGNATGGDTFGYGYNDRNRMTVVQRNGQTVGSYTYNAMGQRVAKAASANQRFAYDEGSQLLGEYGSTSRSYIWLDSLPVAVVVTDGTTGAVSYVHADGLGTPRVVTDGTGATTWQWSYQVNSFSEKPPSAAGPLLNLRFPGQYYDAESGLHYNVQRDYDPTGGRYVQSDPLGIAPGPSTYAYVGSSPLSNVDPSGLACNGNGCWNTTAESGYAAAGNWGLYYQAACAGGDPYACRGREVATNADLPGLRGALTKITNMKLRASINYMHPALQCDQIEPYIDSQMEAIRVGLVQARVATLIGATPENPYMLNRRVFADFHHTVFQNNGAEPGVFGGDLWDAIGGNTWSGWIGQHYNWCETPACTPYP